MRAVIKRILYSLPKPVIFMFLSMFEWIYYNITVYKIKKLYPIKNESTAGAQRDDREKKNRPRILFYHVSGLSFGGTEKFLQIIAKHLDKTKFDVYYMYSAKPRPTTGPNRLDGRLQYMQGSGVHLVEFSYESLDQSYPYIVRGMSPTVNEVISKFEIDLYITAGSGYTEFPFNIIKSIPIVLLNIFGVPNAQKNIYKNICISHAVKDKVARTIPEHKTDVTYIQSEQPKEEYKAFGLELRKKLGIADADVVFGRIGRADDNIFDPIGINAFEQVIKGRLNTQSKAHYIIMSPPPILVDIVKKRNIPNVHFLPPSGDEKDVWTFHYALDALAHFRLDGESFGLNIAESMIAGNPIITHKSHIWNAQLEYLDPEFSFVCDKDDVNGYADAVKKICAAKESGAIVAMKNKSREKGCSLFVIENSIKHIENIIDTALFEVSIFTRPGTILFPGCITYYAKYIARKILRIKRGPDVVLNSLIRGLTETGTKFNINPPLRKTAKIVHVLSNPDALRWAIRHKKDGAFSKIIAGPNITILPSDYNRLLCDPAINTILVPSQWSKDAHIRSENSITNKIKIWPAGVAIPDLDSKTPTAIPTDNLKNDDGTVIAKATTLSSKPQLLVFIKQVPQDLINSVLKTLEKSSVHIKVMTYGKFTQKEYFQELQQSKGMVYLQQVESQGIALQEAWSFNVPTLVWNKGYFTYPNTNITIEGNVSAPYLTEDAGLFFRDAEDFSNKLQIFLSRIDSFKARDYCITNLSDTASIKIYKGLVSAHD